MLKRFLVDRSGNYVMLLAVMTLPLLLAIGFSVDYVRYVAAKQHLQDLADAASLAVAASPERDDTKLRVLAGEMVVGNTSRNRIENVTVASLDIKDDKVDLGLGGNIPTYFMGLANIHRLDVQASALAVRAVTGSVEVALVLDNTESMNYENKIQTLKKAAAGLVTQLHKSDSADVRIALVPYAEQINVGLKNRNASWLSVPADYTKTVTTTTNHEGYWDQKTKKTDICLEWREAGSRQVEKDGVWVTETWSRACSKYKYENVGEQFWVDPKTTTNTSTTSYKWFGCVGSRVVNKKLLLDDLSPSILYPGYVDTKQKCLTEIIPLTDNEKTIQDGITGMVTSRSGYTPQTYIPGGVMWGVNVLSSSEPYSEGLAYDSANAKPRKVIVLMTDGLNTRRVNLTGTLNMDYLNGGALLGDTNSANANQRLAANADTTTLCTYAKSKAIEIFSIAFMVDDGPAKTMLQGCATDAEHYFDASDSAKLLASFEKIARSLTQVRLAR
ncbi:TadE/TadG family type IV pilus assembly protein [Mesorhizobium sp. A623]